MGSLSPPRSSNGPGAHFSFPKIREWATRLSIFFERPASGRKHRVKMKGTRFEKCTFCDVLFSLGKTQIRKQTCFKHRAFLVDLFGDLSVSASFTCSCFSDPKKAEQAEKKDPLWVPILRFGLPKLPKGPFRSKKKAPNGPFRVLEGAQRINGSQPPCTRSCRILTVPRLHRLRYR